MSVVEHVTAINRARTALDWLEKHPATTRNQLGAARDLVNQAHNLNTHNEVWDAINALEDMVCGIYGGRPD